MLQLCQLLFVNLQHTSIVSAAILNRIFPDFLGFLEGKSRTPTLIAKCRKSEKRSLVCGSRFAVNGKNLKRVWRRMLLPRVGAAIFWNAFKRFIQTIYIYAFVYNNCIMLSAIKHDPSYQFLTHRPGS